MSEFNVQNSARRIVQDKTNWKSRPLDLGNRHRTTLNFGDLVPAYWQHVLPGDKLKIDCSVLAKFLPLIAPAFSRMKIKTEWFYVPLRQISPTSLRALQDFKPEDAVSTFSSLLQRGSFNFEPKLSDNQQQFMMEGFPSVPAWWISAWFSGGTSTVFNPHSFDAPWTSLCYAYNGSLPLKHWRTQKTINQGSQDFLQENLGLEDFVCFASKNRCRKFLSYLGLPLRLTTMRNTNDAIQIPTADVRSINSYTSVVFQDGSRATLDSMGDNNNAPLSDVYQRLVFGNPWVSVESETAEAVTPFNYGVFSSMYVDFLSSATSDTVTFSGIPENNCVPNVPCSSRSLVTLLPAMAYQKIYNDFYRDEKLQPEEVRTYPYAYYDSNRQFVYDGSQMDAAVLAHSPNWSTLQHNIYMLTPMYGIGGCTRLFNNLFMLRRRNRAKDVLSSCVTDKVLVNRLANTSTAPNVFQSNLFAKVEKFLIKKEFTGSTWAEWLSNFFGENSNDYLNNNVIFLGAKESTVSISENIQSSQTTEGDLGSAQGNRAGLASDFHNGDSIYFRAPDFGVIMCIVSVIPDDIDNFNGLQERFVMDSPFAFNLPDFQNIGFSPVFNSRANVGVFDKLTAVPTPFAEEVGAWFSNDVFGYQPFGYHWTYTPNVISGDFQTSLRFWHQSPDLDSDFTNFDLSSANERFSSWVDGQLALNANLPAIGLRQQPLSANLAAQYYNNVFAVVNDESGDHIVSDMRFFVTCHRNTAFFTDAVGCDQ